ncbi:MAG: alpha/beta hydrolase [Gammaproteobacteria bacterium]|nr:alpha/beta hydrolase [Gammaproteobacteria bacterium]
MNTSRPSRETLDIIGPAGTLEAILEDPQVESDRVAVVCHPHPLHGGTMQNKVAHTLARTFNSLGVPAFRFNFRGVGNSEGSYDQGVGETEDALAVLDYAGRRFPGRSLWLAGFSFGARVALEVSARRSLDLLITVAPPVGRLDMSGISQPACRWIIVQGGSDELVDADAVVAWVDSLEPGPELMMFEGVDHFFHGQLVVLRESLLASLGPELEVHA